jgi:hypothetical protein
MNISATGVYGSMDYQTLDFVNVLGYVKFSVTESSGKIKSLTVRAADGWTNVWGKSANVFAWTNAYIHIPDEEGLKSVMLQPDSVFEPGDYYIALCPGTYYYGLIFEFENEDGYIAKLSINQEVELKAGEIMNIGLVRDSDFKPSPAMRQQKERECLVALYNATGGQNWNRNDNWCSEAPVSEWYGVTVDNEGYVTYLDLSYNNLNGSIPREFCGLSKLKNLTLGNNAKLTGCIPDNIGDLVSLESLSLLEQSGYLH